MQPTPIGQSPQLAGQPVNTLQVINEVIAQDLKRNDNDPRKFVTERGIVLRLEKVPRTLQMKVMQKFPDPVPPMMVLEGYDDPIPNYADPFYNAAMQQIQIDRALAAERVWFSRGVTVVTMPQHVVPPDSQEWLEGLEDLLDDVPARGPARLAAWLAYYALPTEDEQARLIARIAQFSGSILEADVADAIESFPGGTGGGTDPVPAETPATESGPENSVPQDSPNGGATV